jgi:hypothetical protein
MRIATRLLAWCVVTFGASAPGACQEDAPNAYADLLEITEGEAVRWIPAPFPEGREAWFAKTFPADFERLKGFLPTGMVLHSQMDKTEQRAASYGAELQLSLMVRSAVTLQDHEIVGDPALRELPVPGDFVVAASASQESIVERLNAILRDEIKVDIELAFAMRETDVYVARGEFVPAPKVVEGRRISGRHDFPTFFRAIASLIHMPVVSEATAMQGVEVEWTANLADAQTIDRERRQEDIEKLLADFSKQSGLTFTRDRRPVRVPEIRKAAARE